MTINQIYFELCMRNTGTLCAENCSEAHGKCTNMQRACADEVICLGEYATAS